ncbi:MAG: ATP phosphoribosyltransferase regulatory subunit, partial [Pseudomonadota bacterium]|nr:ATP phosphoribosyltransferase regulatory subunit [Pseudomonadota bacterium]
MTNEIIKVVRGFRDVYSNTDIKLLESFRIAISNITNQYGINELRTPILEKAELFNRSIGATTEIVNKEMYVFEDRNGDALSLRPEGTASCVRSALENNLIFDRGIKRKKYWYFGPMFRRERPQKGRFRQFDQFGIEYFGFDNINSDLEIIF